MVSGPGHDTWRRLRCARKAIVYVGTGADACSRSTFVPAVPRSIFDRAHLVTQGATSDMAISADGRALFVVAAGTLDTHVAVINADPNSPLPGEQVGEFTIPSVSNDLLSLVETSPDNKNVAVYDRGAGTIALFDATGAADGVAPIPEVQAFRGISDMEFSPSGLQLYMADVGNNLIALMNTDVDDPNFGLVTQLIPIDLGTPTPFTPQ
jgi:DNA-binding beta-propeller fold protein YncE